MTELNQIYKCNICGNIIEMIHNGAGELVCCGQLMGFQQEKTEEHTQTLHRPVIEKNDAGVIVKVGSEAHPMTSEHHIEWIEIVTEHRTYRKTLDLDQQPWAEFFIEAEHITARAYCNMHGLWKK